MKARVLIKDIPKERRIQLREVKKGGANKELVDALVSAYESGDLPPPPVVFFDGDVHWLADGNHRWAAAEEMRFRDLEVDIRKGGHDEALLFAAQANRTHGLRRTNEDKRLAVEAVLKLRPKWSNRRIADHVGVGPDLVGDVRRQLSETDSSMAATERVGKDGKTRKVPEKKPEPKPTPTPEPTPEPVPTEPPASSERGRGSAPIPAQGAPAVPPAAPLPPAAETPEDTDEWEWDRLSAIGELSDYLDEFCLNWPDDEPVTPIINTLTARIDALQGRRQGKAS